VLKFYLGPLFSESLFHRFISPTLLTAEQTAVLRSALISRLTNANVVTFSPVNPVHQQLVQSAILSAEDANCALTVPSEFHFQFAMRFAYPDKSSIVPESDGIDEWTLAVLSTFERSVLQNKENWAAGGLPKEVVLQQMFHRGASLHLDPATRLSGEISSRYRDNELVVAEIAKSDTGATGNHIMCELNRCWRIYTLLDWCGLRR